MPTSIPSVRTFMHPDLVGAVDLARNPAEAAAFWLRRDIIRGVFEPEERLAVDVLSDFYGVGYSPMREAILTLACSGLVFHEHQRGRFVAPVSLKDWCDVVNIHQFSVKKAIALAIEHGDSAWEERVVVALYRALRMANFGPPADPEQSELWHNVRRSFHTELRSGAQSEILSEFVKSLADRVERYVTLFADRALEQDRDHHTQHKVLVQALMFRDPDRLGHVIDEYFGYGLPIRTSVTARLKALEAAKAAGPAAPANRLILAPPAVIPAAERKRGRRLNLAGAG